MGSDDGENRMSSVGVNEMIFHEYRSVDKVIEEINKINLKSVNQYIKNNFDLEKVAAILMGPNMKTHQDWISNYNFSKKRKAY